MPTVVYLDSRFVASPEEARVSLFDRGYLFGDTIFETLRAYGGVAFALGDHLDRLEHASRETGIDLPLDRRSIGAVVGEAVRRSGAASAYVRITVSRGEGGVGLGTTGCDRPILSVVVKEYAGYPVDAREQGIATAILRVRKVPAVCLDPAMKTGSCLPNVLAHRELERRGMIEGILLSTSDAVVSGTVSNLFVVHGDRLRTPDEASGCRPGVTRAHLLEVAARAGLRAEPGPIGVGDLETADEAFFTNTLMECLPVHRLEGRELGSARADSSTRRLHAAYRALLPRG